MNSQIPQELKATASLSMPALVDQPFMGSGYCVIAADEAIQQELESWPAVLSADVSSDTGEAVITLSDASPDLDPVLEAMESLRYPASIMSTHESGRR